MPARRLGAVTPVSCVKPTYGAVMSGDMVGGLVQLAFVGIGAGAGVLLGGAAASRGRIVGAIAGGAVGLVAGLYPSLVAQRAVTRSAECTQPGLGALFAYNAGKAAIAGAGASVMRSVAPANPWLPSALATAIFLGAPLVGKAVIRT